MKVSNISLADNVEIGQQTTINNVAIGKNVKISQFCSVYGGPEHILEIGEDSYIGMYSYINGYNAKLSIGKRVSIAQHVSIMTDSGPNASKKMQKYYPVKKKRVIISDDCWVGIGAVIMPGVVLGRCSVVAANSFVNRSFPAYSVIGGTPAKLIKTLNK